MKISNAFDESIDYLNLNGNKCLLKTKLLLCNALAKNSNLKSIERVNASKKNEGLPSIRNILSFNNGLFVIGL